MTPSSWHRHRSAPLRVLLAGAVVLFATAVVAAVFYVSMVRAARGLPAVTAGLRAASLAYPPDRRAAYRASLVTTGDRRTPAGTPSVAHHWRVRRATDPSEAPLCDGHATDGLLATDGTSTRSVELPAPASLFATHLYATLPDRVLATCSARLGRTDGAGFVYEEEVLAPGTLVEIVACVRHSAEGAVLVACDDDAPSRIYPVGARVPARAHARAAMLEMSACALVFVLVCFGAGIAALWTFDRARRRIA